MLKTPLILSIYAQAPNPILLRNFMYFLGGYGIMSSWWMIFDALAAHVLLILT